MSQTTDHLERAANALLLACDAGSHAYANDFVQRGIERLRVAALAAPPERRLAILCCARATGQVLRSSFGHPDEARLRALAERMSELRDQLRESGDER